LVGQGVDGRTGQWLRAANLTIVDTLAVSESGISLDPERFQHRGFATEPGRGFSADQWAWSFTFDHDMFSALAI
jgi:hypothetical protein